MTLKVYNYNNNHRIAILLFNAEGECYGDFTINLPEFFISDIDEGFISEMLNCKNSDGFNIVNVLKKLGIIKESYGLRSYNYGKYEYVKFDLEKLKEYDDLGVQKFIEKIESINTIHLYNASF